MSLRHCTCLASQYLWSLVQGNYAPWLAAAHRQACLHSRTFRCAQRWLFVAAQCCCSMENQSRVSGNSQSACLSIMSRPWINKAGRELPTCMAASSLERALGSRMFPSSFGHTAPTLMGDSSSVVFCSTSRPREGVSGVQSLQQCPHETHPPFSHSHPSVLHGSHLGHWVST